MSLSMTAQHAPADKANKINDYERYCPLRKRTSNQNSAIGFKDGKQPWWPMLLKSD
jgi:hypothetical protein